MCGLSIYTFPLKVMASKSADALEFRTIYVCHRCGRGFRLPDNDLNQHKTEEIALSSVINLSQTMYLNEIEMSNCQAPMSIPKAR